jgi:VanZ family protein
LSDFNATSSALPTWRLTLVVYFATLTTLTHWPTMDPLGPEHPSPDKLAHFIAFALLAVLLERSRLLPRGWMAMLCVVVWSVVDEWTQGMMSSHRDTSWNDIVAGWMGVLAVTVGLLAMRPAATLSDESPWPRAIRTIDMMVARGGGGVLAAVVGSVVTVATFPLFFAILWVGFGWSLSSVCVLLAMGCGLLAAAPLIRRAWRQASGPRWPVPAAWTWLFIPAGIGIGVLLNRPLVEIGLPGLGFALMLLGAIDGAAVAVRLAWVRATLEGHT